MQVKEGARVVLINNINTSDCLVNGSFGTLIKIVPEKCKADHMIIQFDNSLAGAKQREDHPIQSRHYEKINGTPLNDLNSTKCLF